MIPARLGSQRLKKKNLQLLKGTPLITHAIRKAKKSEVFDEIWVNSESDEIGKIALAEGVMFHKRPEELANNQATSEDFVYEFLKMHECDLLVQVHSIAPLLTQKEISNFVQFFRAGNHDVLLSTELIQIECAFQNRPINFAFNAKTNSQELDPIQRISWSITGWKRSTYVDAYDQAKCATYSGNVGYFPIDRLASHVIKDQNDLDLAEALFDTVHTKK